MMGLTHLYKKESINSMTAQTKDFFYFKGVSYYLVGVNPRDKFFLIQELGIYPKAASTANWRGYVATFTVTEDKLFLKELITNNGGNEKVSPVMLNGVLPLVNRPENVSGSAKWQQWHYSDIDLFIPYTGKVLITDKYNNYGHTAFYEPRDYFGNMIELRFIDGHFTGEDVQRNESHSLRQRFL